MDTVIRLDQLKYVEIRKILASKVKNLEDAIKYYKEYNDFL